MSGQMIRSAPKEANGGAPVNVQDQHTRPQDLWFIQASASPTTLAANADIGDTTITVTSVTGFVAGAVVGMFKSVTDQYYFGKQVGAIAGSVVTLDTSIDQAFLAGDTIIAATDDMNVAGTLATPSIFQIGPFGTNTGLEVDITRIHGIIYDDAAMDDSKFGSLAELPNGLVLRHSNGINTNLWNMKSNGEIALLCGGGDAFYPDKVPAGVYAFRFRNTYAGQDKHGVTIRLEPGDILEVLVQDDLTDLTTFHMMAQGHAVGN